MMGIHAGYRLEIFHVIAIIIGKISKMQLNRAISFCVYLVNTQIKVKIAEKKLKLLVA